MNTNFNTSDYVFFVLDEAHGRNASFGFRAAYTDKQGNFQKLETPRVNEKTGEKEIRKITIQKGHKTLRVHKSQEKELVFFRNHPNCKGSPNGYYRNLDDGSSVQSDIWFSEVNTEKDAELAVDYRKIRVEAQNRILELSKNPDELMAFGIAVGYAGSNNQVMFKLLEHAEKDPEYIINELDSPDLVAKSLFREGVNTNIIVKRGLSWMLEDFEIGLDNESCIKTIRTNDDVMRLLKKKLNREDEEKFQNTSDLSVFDSEVSE